MKYLKLFESFAREELTAAIKWLENNWTNKNLSHIEIDKDVPFSGGARKKVFYVLYDSEGFSEENDYWHTLTANPGITAVLSFASRFGVETALEFFSDYPPEGATAMPDQLIISYSSSSKEDTENYDSE